MVSTQSAEVLALPARDFVRIKEAAALLNVSEQTLRNWDGTGRLHAYRHPVNGYRHYRVSDLHAILREVGSQEFLDWESADEADGPSAEFADLPSCHWSRSVALDPKHRPQLWGSPSSTVRRDWRKFPQEAHVLSPEGLRYRRFTAEEIAILQGFDPSQLDFEGLTERERIGAMGDAVPPPLAKAIVAGMAKVRPFSTCTSVEICAGSGGLAEGSADAGLEHLLLVDVNKPAGHLLSNGRRWSAEAVTVGDVRAVDFKAYAGQVGLLSGGPPCQPWSLSGARRGQDDPRDLLGSLSHIIADVQPEAFLFENVPGLSAAANAEYLQHVVRSLRRPSRDLHYGVTLAILNAADYGVPQVRRRLFLLGFRDAPSSLASAAFDAVHAMRTHGGYDSGNGVLPPWVTVGQAIGSRPDPGGWRRWIMA